MTGDAEAHAFHEWLHGLDLDELTEYRGYLEAFADDDSDLGRFAAITLPTVIARERLIEVRELMRDSFELVFPGASIDVFWEHLGAINRASRQLDSGTDPLDIVAAALTTSGAVVPPTEDGRDG